MSAQGRKDFTYQQGAESHFKHLAKIHGGGYDYVQVIHVFLAKSTLEISSLSVSRQLFPSQAFLEV